MTAPATCTISGTLLDGAGAVLAGALLRFRLAGTTDTAGSGPPSFVSHAPQAIYTDNNGVFSVVLPQGMAFRVEIPALAADRTGTVPSAATANLSEISTSDWSESASRSFSGFAGLWPWWCC